MIYLMHRRGCGGRAYRLVRPSLPTEGEQIMADDVLTVDGKPVFDGDQMLCGSCGVWLWPEDLQIEFFDDFPPQENTTGPTNSMLTERDQWIIRGIIAGRQDQNPQPRMTATEVLESRLRDHAPEIAKNIMDHNAVLRMCKKP